MREPGYYWVWSDDQDKWRPAEWDGTRWWIIGVETWFPAEDMDEAEIGARLEPPLRPSVDCAFASHPPT